MEFFHSNRTSSNGGTVDFCTCSAASGTETYTSTYAQCSPGPYTVTIVLP